jgi:hypothetical protein
MRQTWVTFMAELPWFGPLGESAAKDAVVIITMKNRYINADHHRVSNLDWRGCKAGIAKTPE